MAEEGVKLVGFWASPFAYRVIWALKMKGVEYEYIEEDIFNKSPLLFQVNPVHAKVPVLIHGGRAIAESVVILEYIDETWPHQPLLLTKDPLHRAMARFWIQFGDERYMLFKGFFGIRTREEGEKEIARAIQVLKILEEQALGDKKFFNGDATGMVDLTYGWLGHWMSGMEEVVGVSILEPNTFPRLHAWAQNFLQIPIIKDNLPPRREMLMYFKEVRDVYVK